MKLLAPANPKELTDRARWFKTPEALKLAKEKGVEFGIEIKGPLENIHEAPPIYWGLHLPDMLATEWYYYPEQRAAMMKELERVAVLKPDYAVLHGIHLLWQPPAKEYVHRYVDTSSAREYFKILDANIELINQLKNLFDLKIENFPLYFYYMKDKDEYLPYTFLCTGIGRLDDLVYLKKKTGIDIMFDIEHMLSTLNLLNRKRNYRNLPIREADKLAPDEKKLKDIFGFYLKKDYIPYLDREITLKEMIKKIETKFYHVTGSQQDVINGKKVTAHGPIEIDDRHFRQNLRLILAQKPEVILVETSTSQFGGKTWAYLRPNETEISFRNLCQILQEELWKINPLGTLERLKGIKLFQHFFVQYSEIKKFR